LADFRSKLFMKKSELFFSALQVPVDFLMIVLAGVSAFVIRDIPQIIALKPKLYNFPFDIYFKAILIIAPVFVLIYAIEGLYDIRVTRKFRQEAFKIFSATSLGLVILIVTIFLKREWFSSRFIILSGWAFVVFYVTIARFILQKIQKFLLVKKGIGTHRLLLIGHNGKIEKIRQMIKRNRSLGFRIVDQIESGSVRMIKEIKQTKGVDDIIICDSSITDMEQEKIIDYCSINNITYKYIPNTLQTAQIELGMLEGEPIIEVKHTPLDGWGRILKRTFDIVASIILTIIFSPLLLLIAILIKLESKGPVIYKNERIGSDGEKFFVFKFRYMKWEHSISAENPNCDEALKYEKKLIEEKSVRKGPLYKIKNDPRKTRVGAFIEKYSIDELPQLFNVIRGNMSMVGPRPHQEREVEKYSEYHRRLLTIKPGITGMAQVSGRSDLPFEDEYKLDVYYIENWSLKMDILICFKTVGVLFNKRKNVS
jgi:exopolysaccharide biosynthesis polyprenyl glycosylphosphotransferase